MARSAHHKVEWPDPHSRIDFPLTFLLWRKYMGREVSEGLGRPARWTGRCTMELRRCPDLMLKEKGVTAAATSPCSRRNNGSGRSRFATLARSLRNRMSSTHQKTETARAG